MNSSSSVILNVLKGHLPIANIFMWDLCTTLRDDAGRHVGLSVIAMVQSFVQQLMHYLFVIVKFIVLLNMAGDQQENVPVPKSLPKSTSAGMPYAMNGL